MTILSESTICLKIHLNKYELKKYFISYNNINIANPNIRKTIMTLVNIAINTSDFEPNGKRIIEIFPTISGGCIFKFTTEPTTFASRENNEIKKLKFKSSKPKNTSYIFCFKTFDNLLSVVEELCKNRKSKKYISSLYIANNNFFLKISLPIFDIKTGLFINEFCEYSTKGKFAESRLQEYSKELIKKNATEILGKYFLKL